ncbi:nuclear transport factor 2 family protein [Marinifilum sp.]|uniref:nuclear transport factor 2 family protein n=1 Tax=Marinifilum sp. TaxID=2033137 RepID=UPI003BACF9D0
MHRSTFIILITLACIFSACQKQSEYSEKNINQLLNSWHKAAADAKLEEYFRLMTENATYIGTDPNERWTREEFYQFCKPYFEKGRSWDFKAFDRKIYASENNKTIWFDELLNTWMGVCRGSGVLSLENGEYKISHYHLSVTIKNESIKEFLQIKQD